MYAKPREYQQSPFREDPLLQVSPALPPSHKIHDSFKKMWVANEHHGGDQRFKKMWDWNHFANQGLESFSNDLIFVSMTIFLNQILTVYGI